MLNKDRHKRIMLEILKDIYSDIKISSLLGFKGGTAAFLFYDLPRFSVDLDFDLLEQSQENTDLLFARVKKILEKYGEIKDSQKKFATIFFSLSYAPGEHQIKIEINNRNTGASYEMQSYLGIPMLITKKDSMLAGKLVALTARNSFTARDLFDIHFFLKQHWEPDKNVLIAHGIESELEYIQKCITFVENIPDNKMLVGLGELIDEKQKDWVRSSLKSDTLFLLRLAADTK